MKKANDYHWIFSAGGPLVLLQASTLEVWRGVFGADYEAACAVTGYIGVLKKEHRDVLVLADEPMQTTHFNDGTDDFLVRWIYGTDEETVVGTLQSMPHALKDATEEVRLELAEDRQLIIDSGAEGATAAERLELSLLPGSYTVKVFKYDPSPDVSLIVHQFIRN